MSGEVGGHEGRSDGLHRLKHAIIDKYVERFPAYDRDKDEQLLAQRAEEAVARARVRFVEGLGDTPALRVGVRCSQQSRKPVPSRGLGDMTMEASLGVRY